MPFHASSCLAQSRSAAPIGYLVSLESAARCATVAPRIHRPTNPRGPVRELWGNNTEFTVGATCRALKVIGDLWFNSKVGGVPAKMRFMRSGIGAPLMVVRWLLAAGARAFAT